MIHSAAKYIRAFFIPACIAFTTIAAALDAGCDDLAHDDLVLPANTIVDVKLLTTEPNGAVGAMSDALALLNGKINGITFVLDPNQYDGDHAQISVSIGGANTNGDLGSFAGRVLTIGGKPLLDGGELVLYSDLANCGPTKTSKCLDPAVPGYYKAMQGVFVHEFLHALGSQHSAKDNIMFPGVKGVNGLASSNWALDCLIPQLNKLINPTPAPGCK